MRDGRGKSRPPSARGPTLHRRNVSLTHLRVLRNPMIIHHGKEQPFTCADSFAILTMTTTTVVLSFFPRLFSRYDVRLPFSDYYIVFNTRVDSHTQTLAHAHKHTYTESSRNPRRPGILCKSASYTPPLPLPGLTPGRNGCLGLFSPEWTPSSPGT